MPNVIKKPKPRKKDDRPISLTVTLPNGNSFSGDGPRDVVMEIFEQWKAAIANG